jgi:hypothetical protein
MTTPTEPSVRGPSLPELRDRARSLEAEPADIDALLVAMDRPVVPGEDVRSRADVLQRIIDDPVLGGLRGGDRRRVDETAVHALLALGEPYAHELSADGQRLLQNAPRPPPSASAEEDTRESSSGSWNGFIGGGAFVCGLGEFLLLCVLFASTELSKLGVLLMLCLLSSTVLTLLLPGAQLFSRTRVSTPNLVIAFNVLSLPGVGLVGLLPLVTLDGNDSADQAALLTCFAAIVNVMARLAVIRRAGAQNHSPPGAAR